MVLNHLNSILAHLDVPNDTSITQVNWLGLVSRVWLWQRYTASPDTTSDSHRRRRPHPHIQHPSFRHTVSHVKAHNAFVTSFSQNPPHPTPTPTSAISALRNGDEQQKFHLGSEAGKTKSYSSWGKKKQRNMTEVFKVNPTQVTVILSIITDSTGQYYLQILTLMWLINLWLVQINQREHQKSD